MVLNFDQLAYFAAGRIPLNASQRTQPTPHMSLECGVAALRFDESVTSGAAYFCRVGELGGTKSPESERQFHECLWYEA